MDLRVQIIDFLKTSGPIIPVRLAKELKTNILMASAFLSELVSSGKVRVSYLKVGGTPLYYLMGQESILQKFSGNISQKEKMAYDELFSKKVLEDRKIEPVTRVALKELKDFAVSMTFENEIYWKWYMISDTEAIKLIKENHLPENLLSTEPVQIQQKLVTQGIPVQVTNSTNIVLLQSMPEVVEQEFPVVKLEQDIKEDMANLPESKDSLVSMEKKPDDFIRIVEEYFKHNNIKAMEIKNKRADIECIIRVPSNIGEILCYCRARNKKSITDADVSSAFLQSQYKGLPLLFLYSGKLTKKAQLMIIEYKKIIIKEIS